MNPGKNAQGLLTGGKEIEPQEFSFIDNMVEWVPNNIIAGMAETNMLQIIIVAVIIGVALLSLGEKVSGMKKLINEGAILMLKITDIIMMLAPIGILALLANLVGTTDTKILYESLHYVLTALIGLAILLFIVYPTMIKIFTKFKPLGFLRR